MNEEEITDYVMQYTRGKTGVSAVGPMIEGIIAFVAWQQEHLVNLEKRVLELELEKNND